MITKPTHSPKREDLSSTDNSRQLFHTLADPLGFEAGDANLRRYVGNNATNATDPSGLEEATRVGTRRVTLGGISHYAPIYQATDGSYYILGPNGRSKVSPPGVQEALHPELTHINGYDRPVYRVPDGSYFILTDHGRSRISEPAMKVGGVSFPLPQTGPRGPVKPPLDLKEELKKEGIFTNAQIEAAYHGGCRDLCGKRLGMIHDKIPEGGKIPHAQQQVKLFRTLDAALLHASKLVQSGEKVRIFAAQSNRAPKAPPPDFVTVHGPGIDLGEIC